MDHAEALLELAAYVKRGRPSHYKLLKRARKLGLDIEDVDVLRAQIKQASDKVEVPTHMASDGHTMEAEASVSTLDDLLRACAADMTAWQVDKWEANVWGTTKQVKAKFIRRLAGEVQRVNTPIRMPRALGVNRVPGERVAVIIPDSQIGFTRDIDSGKLTPFHSRAAMDAGLQVVELVKPDTMVWLGDMLDFAPWGRFRVEPDKRYTTQPSIDEGHWWAAAYRQAAPSAEFLYFEGNHEKRIQHALAERLDEAVGIRAAGSKTSLLSLPHLLALDTLDIKYIPYGDSYWIWDKVRAEHGTNHGKNAVEKTLYRSLMYSLMGHIHRMDVKFARMDTPQGMRTTWSASPGCMCHTDGRVPAFKPGEQDWHNGLAILYEVGDQVLIELVSIVDGLCAVNGTILLGRDRTAEVREATGHKGM